MKYAEFDGFRCCNFVYTKLNVRLARANEKSMLRVNSDRRKKRSLGESAASTERLHFSQGPGLVSPVLRRYDAARWILPPNHEVPKADGSNRSIPFKGLGCASGEGVP